LNLISKASEIALKVHGSQVDKKGYPYMSHVSDIARRVSQLGEPYEIVGLLHDAIEDADSKELQEAVIADIKASFSNEIFQSIAAMTKKPDEDYFDEYLARVKDNKLALQVKIADASHNLSKAHLIEDLKLQEKLRAKYIKVLDELGVDGSLCEKPIIFQNGSWVEDE